MIKLGSSLQLQPSEPRPARGAPEAFLVSGLLSKGAQEETNVTFHQRLVGEAKGTLIPCHAQYSTQKKFFINLYSRMPSLKNMRKSNLENQSGPLWLKVEAGMVWAPGAH